MADNIELLKSKVVELKKDDKRSKRIIDDLKFCLGKKEARIKELEKNNQMLQTKVKDDNNFDDNLKKSLPMLTENQLKLMMGNKKRVIWNAEELSKGFTMSYFSAPGYHYLTKELKYPLPSIRTLNKHALSFTVAPGFLEDSFKTLDSFGKSLKPYERLVIIGFDEMKCKSIYEYHKGLDCVMGPHSQMQVVMVRGLMKKFKQPLFVDFDRRVTKEMLMETITKLHAAGFTVVGIVNDNGGSNVGLWKDLDLSISREFPIVSTFLHPITLSKIMVFSDVPHCLKLLRNWFIDGGLVLPDGTVLHANKIKQLLLLTKTEITPIPNLTILHVECKKEERQNVRLATELFSHSVAEALRRYFPQEDKEARKLADFIDTVNNWFDVMNSYSPAGKLYKKPYGLDLHRQNEVLDEMFYVIVTMKCYNKKKDLQDSLQTFQKGILLSITSLKELYKVVKETYSISYILTHRNNQDFLENFFSRIRGRGGFKDHPSPIDCLYRIRSVVLGKNTVPCTHSHLNTLDKDPDEFISSCFEKGNCYPTVKRDVTADSFKTSETFENEYENRTDEEVEKFVSQVHGEIVDTAYEDQDEEEITEQVNAEQLDEETSDQFDNEIDKLISLLPQDFPNSMDGNESKDNSKSKSSEDGMEYVSGWIAMKMKSQHPEYSHTLYSPLPCHLADHSYFKHNDIQTTWVHQLSYGGLTKPTEEFLESIRKMEKTFNMIHGDSFLKETNILKNLIRKLELENEDVPIEVIQLFARTRMYMRCKHLNKIAKEESVIAAAERQLQKKLKNIKEKEDGEAKHVVTEQQKAMIGNKQDLKRKNSDTIEDMNRKKIKKMSKILK